MNRHELIKQLVLDTICDDYGNVDQTILHDLTNDSIGSNLNIQRADVVTALSDLVEDGFAQAFILSGKKPHALQGMPSLAVIEENFRTYFFITKKGRVFHQQNPLP